MPQPALDRPSASGSLDSAKPARLSGLRRVSLTLVVATIAVSILAGTGASADTLDKLVIGASAADLVTSEIALSRAGTAEANPLGASTAARVALKVAGTAAVLVISRKVDRKTSRVVKVIAFLAWSGAAIHNAAVRR